MRESSQRQPTWRWAVESASAWAKIVAIPLATATALWAASSQPLFMETTSTAATDHAAPSIQHAAGAVNVQAMRAEPVTPSSIRGSEATTPEQGHFHATLPRLNEPPVTKLSTTTTTSTTMRQPTTAAARTTAEQRGHAALSRISYNWQQNLSEWQFKFSPGRSGVLGYTYTDQKVIEVFVRDSQSDTLLAHVIAHEMGHAVDVSLNSSEDRHRWQEARSITDEPWWPGNGANDFSTGAGDFAESFAAWQVGPGNFRSKLAGSPTNAQKQLMAELAAG